MQYRLRINLSAGYWNAIAWQEVIFHIIQLIHQSALHIKSQCHTEYYCNSAYSDCSWFPTLQQISRTAVAGRRCSSVIVYVHGRDQRSGGATPGPGRSYTPCHWKIGPGAGTCLWYSDGFISLLNFVLKLTFVLMFCLSFLSILGPIRVWMLEC